MTIWRPSIFGMFSTLPISSMSLATRSRRFAPEILVGHLAAAEPQRHLHLVAVLEEADHVAHLDIVVMGVGVRAELDLLDLDDLLLLPRLAFALLRFVLELAEVHDLADRRRGVGGDLDEVEAGIFGHPEAAVGGHDADVLAVCSDEPYFVGPDAIVYTGAGVPLRRGVVGSTRYGLTSLRSFNSDKAAK